MSMTRKMKSLLSRVQGPVEKSSIQPTQKQGKSAPANGRMKIHKGRKLPVDWFFHGEQQDIDEYNKMRRRKE